MDPALEQITREALRLAPAQRAELADVLVESLDASTPDAIQTLWVAEAQRRLSEIREGRVEPIPGEEVLAEARRLVKR